ncbi:hypothetical protein UFOVP240_116 [uncultured Caudovirales phage]|uniref:DUF6321 domain-containing protein n=1 Tax=uncultured Caudovirales phage TaxID=2100421 RepID=A0A6J7WT34_9CAUD|nr:hypothetical protein UFOVP240_116 [uncultured Caudovirales phage]
MFRFNEWANQIDEAKNSGCNCWTGYKRVPGTKPCAPGSCIKEGWAPGYKGDNSMDKVEKHRVAVTISDPNHTMVSKRKETQQKHVRVSATNQLDARVNAEKHYRKQGFKVHSSEHVGVVKEDFEEQFDLIEEMVMDLAEEHKVDPEVIWENFEDIDDTELYEAAVDAKGYKSSTGGLTQKGRDAYNRAEGSNLKAPVTTPPSKLKDGSKAANRRKSFCARMSGVDGPMKKPNGEPTRKALALRKWNC